MPASSQSSLLHIKESLQSSLARQTGANPQSSLDQRLASQSKHILMHKIEFRQAEKASQSYQLESLRAKYTPLNAGSGKCPSPELARGLKSPESIKMSGESLPAPKVVLYPREKIKLEWSRMSGAGAGLVNLGNTCFLNSTLQCLTYTAPLSNYLISENHSNTCKIAGFCMLCELQRHIKRCYDQPGAIKPLAIVHKLRVIAKHMHLGRQEDAHEFLRYVIDHSQKACLYGHSKLDNFSKETTAINQIFGGYLRSQVVCLKCNSRSNTYDPFLDISLDIKNAPSVVKALEKYIHPERLDSDNAYNCLKCKQKVPAHKRFTIHKAPNVLTIQLKRFDCSRPSAKVTRHVHFPERLDLKPYMSQRRDGVSVMYQLYAVLVHSGYSCNSGHYYCFVKAANRAWHCMNDQHVGPCGTNRVLSAEAYLLFYKRIQPSQQTQSKPGPMIGPKLQFQSAMSQSAPLSSSSLLADKKPMLDEMGNPVPRKPMMKSSTIVNESQVRPPKPPTPIPKATGISMASDRSKISFGIKPKDQKEEKPRLVLRIKHGTVCYNSVEDRKENGEKIQKLVPYNGDSDSEDESKPELSNGNGKPHTVTNGTKSHTVSSNGDKNKSFEPVIDEKLKATTTVPGAYGPLDKTASWLHGKKRFSKDDIHNISLVNKSKPLRRSFSDDGLTIDVEPPKVNSTTKWSVLQDCQVSPSLASESSINSINSTTDWHVLPGTQPKTPVVAEAQHIGWTVTPVRNGNDNHNQHITESQPDTPRNHAEPPKKKPSGIQRLLCMNTLTDSPGEQEPLVSDRDKLYDLSVYDFHDEEKPMTKLPRKPVPEEPENEPEPESSNSSQKKKKKHKKHKKNRAEEIDVDTESHKKKKKKKKHKRKHEEEELEESKRRLLDTEEDTSNDQEYAWVEINKDTSTLSEKTDLNQNQVHVQDWDQHIKDGHKGAATKSHTSWDGSKSTNQDVLNNLLKMKNYGSNIQSWDGSSSKNSSDSSPNQSTKRRWSDEYEEELDRGKTKKIKKRHSDIGPHGHHSNAFQKYQDDRNIVKEMRKSGNGFNDHLYGNGFEHDTNGHHRSNHHDRNHGNQRDNHYGHHNKGYHHHRH